MDLLKHTCLLSHSLNLRPMLLCTQNTHLLSVVSSYSSFFFFYIFFLKPMLVYVVFVYCFNISLQSQGIVNTVSLYEPPQPRLSSLSQPKPKTNAIVSTQNTHLPSVVPCLIFNSIGLCNFGLLL
jgi:hypothetical protein